LNLRLVRPLTRVYSMSQFTYQISNITGVLQNLQLSTNTFVMASRMLVGPGGRLRSNTLTIQNALANTNIKYGIYSDNGTGNNPVNLLASTPSSFIPFGFSGNLVFVLQPSPYLQPNTYCWPAIVTDIDFSLNLATTNPAITTIGRWGQNATPFFFPTPWVDLGIIAGAWQTMTLSYGGGSLIDHYPGIPDSIFP
jgi:hypothetical protein